ncbi:CRISPR-associated helicase/endonuclease Cas3 [Hydrogenibacillus schlegelii]
MPSGGPSPGNASSPDNEVDRACIFWGKLKLDANEPQKVRCLPLAAHSLDVAYVLRALAELPGFRRALERAAGRALRPTDLDRLAVLATLHDMGKANLDFQRQIDPGYRQKVGHIRAMAAILDPEVGEASLFNRWLEALPPEFQDWFSDDETAFSYFYAILSHHGRPVKFGGKDEDRRRSLHGWTPGPEGDPFAAIRELVAWARGVFPLAFQEDPERLTLPDSPAFVHRFAGLLMLADWLGSHEHWFPIRPVTFEERLAHARDVVPRLLRGVGLDVRSLRPHLGRIRSFEERFGFPPNSVQERIEHLDPEDDRTRLLILESETGSGKTEAALNWFFKLFAAGKVDGLYFALPTRVAARELYTRVHRAMERWFPDPLERPVTVLAVPGYAQVDGLPVSQVLPAEGEGNRWQEDEGLRLHERRWAAERPKRFLAATVAVGTVDQALLSVVKAAHAHLRSVSLDRSLLVVDEVHASDAYMTHLLEALVRHHHRIGGYAMLISATLGASARQRYLRAAGGAGENVGWASAVEAPYPRITLADGSGLAVPSGREKRVRFTLLPLAQKLEEVAAEIIRHLRSGARVLVVLNTVSRAVSLQKMIEAHPDLNQEWLFRCRGHQGREVVTLHHGRFAPEDRVILDACVSRRLGRGSEGGPILLIGTQTLEQSLDLDADVLITDLVPADVLLQRVGRLHRHNRQDRPEPYRQPASCFVLVPEGDLSAALDEKGNVRTAYKALGYGSVYEDLRMLELTRRMLAGRPDVVIPRDNRLLVESVTHPERLELLADESLPWRRHMEGREGADLSKGIAANYIVASFDEHFGEAEFNVDGAKVTTRLGADTLQVPLSRPVISPFGQTLREITIPAHWAPENPPDEVIVEAAEEGVEAILRFGTHLYRYSRYGLEVISDGKGNRPEPEVV